MGIAADQIREFNVNVDDVVKLVDVGGGVPGLPAVDARLLAEFQASGAGHAKGVVPDPGAVAGTTKFLREDATWASPGASAQTFQQSLYADISANKSTTSALWPGSTTIAAGSNGVSLPQATINVVATGSGGTRAAFPAYGTAYVWTSSGLQTVI